MIKGHAVHKSLLACGALSSLWYVLINVLVPMQWLQYSVLHQTVSELSVIGAPTRTLWVVAVLPYVLLFGAFGFGIMRSAATNRPPRFTGYLITLYSIVNFHWPPMHRREVIAADGATLTDTPHLVWAGMAVALFLMIMGFGAAGLGARFRIYNLLSAVLLLTFGILTSLGAPNIEADQPTPWIGVWERIDIGIFLLWVVVLSAILWRSESAVCLAEKAETGTPP